MEPSDIREFVDRGWDRKDEAKRRYWAERYRREGPEATMAASEALRVHMIALRPDWPTHVEREADLHHHLELVAKMARAADAFIDS